MYQPFNTIFHQKKLNNSENELLIPDLILIGSSGIVVVEVKNHQNGILLGDVNSEKWLDMRTKTTDKGMIVHTTYVQRNYLMQASDYCDCLKDNLSLYFSYDIPIDYFVVIIDNDQRLDGQGYDRRDYLWSMLCSDKHIVHLDSKNENSLSKKINSYHSNVLNLNQIAEIRERLSQDLSPEKCYFI